MTKLEKLYDLASGIREFDLKSKEAILQEINELEEDIIKKDILPIVKERIEPALSQVQRELVLVVDYIPGRPLSVKLSRKAKAIKIDDLIDLTTPDPEAEHGTRKGGKGVTHSKASTLKVIRRDGSILQMPHAKDTLVEAIKEAGVGRVRKLNIICCKVPLVSTTKDKKYGHTQVEVEPGVYVVTHSNNPMKKGFLDTISKAFDLGWKVEIIK